MKDNPSFEEEIVLPSYGDFINSFAMRARAGPYGSYGNKYYDDDSTQQLLHNLCMSIALIDNYYYTISWKTSTGLDT